MTRCPECGGMSMEEISPDNGYGATYCCRLCGYENDASDREISDHNERILRKYERRERRRTYR